MGGGAKRGVATTVGGWTAIGEQATRATRKPARAEVLILIIVMLDYFLPNVRM